MNKLNGKSIINIFIVAIKSYLIAKHGHTYQPARNMAWFITGLHVTTKMMHEPGDSVTLSN